MNTSRKNPYPTRHAYEKIPWVSEDPVHGMQYPTVALVQWLQVGYMNALEINEKLRWFHHILWRMYDMWHITCEQEITLFSKLTQLASKVLPCQISSMLGLLDGIAPGSGTFLAFKQLCRKWEVQILGFFVGNTWTWQKSLHSGRSWISDTPFVSLEFLQKLEKNQY